jgi:alpha-L-fucosidase
MNSHRLSRRSFIKRTTLAAGAGLSAPWFSSCLGSAPSTMTLPSGRRIAAGPYQPTWESFGAHYRCPEWFRDAKFGIWAHWTAQCVPEQGDWYARQMYIEGHRHYKYHLEHYGHPTQFGFKEIDNLWKAEQWRPEELISLYKRAGAKYFFALANHHDNFDNYDSAHHPWNSVNVGPKRDIIGTWARVVRENGLRFGVSNHSAHAWHWLQTAYGYDAEGPMAGRRYDGFTLNRADGRGKWWDGLDPQDLYTGRNMVMPDGVTSVAAANAFYKGTMWTEDVPAQDPAFVESWFLRCKDLLDKYHPDVLYFDDSGLPLGQAGLDIAAHFYNASLGWNGGKMDVVLNSKHMPSAVRSALVEDIERGVSGELRPAPWQTDTCIGSWHYERSLFENHTYKTTAQVTQMLVDIVSKNGNLMLSVPLRANGTLDGDELAFLAGMEKWITINGEGIYGTRPWVVFGEGPSVTGPQLSGQFGGARDVRPYTSEDIRFTTKGDALYAFVMAWPKDGLANLGALAAHSPQLAGRRVSDVTLLGFPGALTWSQTDDGLRVRLPDSPPSEHATTLRIRGVMPS